MFELKLTTCVVPSLQMLWVEGRTVATGMGLTCIVAVIDCPGHPPAAGVMV
jgi:hypothetical protein